MPDALVVNASPLIFLGNAGRLDLLTVIGASRVLVPESVFNEVTATSHADRAARSVAEAGWIQRVAAFPIPVSVLEWDLGPGESDVIVACLRSRDARPVIDRPRRSQVCTRSRIEPDRYLGSGHRSSSAWSC